MQKSFDEVFEDVTKLGTKIKTDEYHPLGKYQIIDQGQEKIAGYTDLKDGLFENVPAVIFGDHTRVIKYVDKPFFLGADGVKVLRSRLENANYRYLYYALKNVKIPNTGYNRHFKWLKEAQINYPSVETQFEIVSTLDGVTSIIEHRQQQLQKLDELVKARFVEMFGDSEFNTMQWPTKKLSELCAVSSSKRIYQNEQCTEGVPFLRISDLNERIDNVKNAPELFIPINKYNELKENGLVPTEGDILVTSRGTLGRCYIVRPEDEFYFQDGMISWLSDLNSQITSVYLSQLFAMSGIQKQIASLQAGSTVAYLSIAMLKKLNIMLPPLDLQEQFAAFVEQTDKSKVAIQKALDEAQLLFDSLMQKYFG